MNGHSPLYWAAAGGNTNAHMRVLEALLRNAANVHWRHPVTGSTALIAATLAGHSRAVHLLLCHGADPNESMNAAGIGPLLACALKDRADCAHILLVAGADLTTHSPYFGGTASVLAANKGNGRTLAVIQRPLLCSALQRLAVATAMVTLCPTSARCSRKHSSFKGLGPHQHHAVPFDLPYDILVRIIELLPRFPTAYSFAVTVIAEAATKPTLSLRRKLLRNADPELGRDPGVDSSGKMGRQQFCATRTSTMDLDNAPELSLDINTVAHQNSQCSSSNSTSSEDQSGPKIVLEFEIPTPAIFREVIELFYSRVAPEKDAGARGAEAVRLATRQQQKLLRQHAPTISSEGAQQFAFQQVFALLQKKYKQDPLSIWRAYQCGKLETAPSLVTSGTISETSDAIVGAAAVERARTMKATVEASQADTESAVVERELAVVQRQIEQME